MSCCISVDSSFWKKNSALFIKLCRHPIVIYGSKSSIHFLSDLHTNQLDWVDWLESIRFSEKLTESIQFLFVSWLVTESIRFHKVDGWVDLIWGPGMIESIELIQNIPKKVNEIERFPEKDQRKRTFSQKGQRNKRYSKKVNIPICWVDWLIWLNHLSHSFDLIESIHMYILSRVCR